MTPSRVRWILLAVAILAGSSGYLVREIGFRRPAQAIPDSANAAVPKLMALPLAGLDGQKFMLAKWQGKPMLVNFWATWCPPCREEMPLLDRTSAEPAGAGVQFVGVAYDDLKQVQAYAAATPTHYPLAVAGGEISNLFPALGNTAQGLPFSVLIGADGSVKRIKLGPFRGKDLAEMLAAVAH